MVGGLLEDCLDTRAGGPPVVEAAVERELRQKREEYTTVEGVLTERIAEYEMAVAELDHVLREQDRELERVPRTGEQRPMLEKRVDRLRKQRWELVNQFLEEKGRSEPELVRLRGEIVEVEAVLE